VPRSFGAALLGLLAFVVLAAGPSLAGEPGGSSSPGRLPVPEHDPDEVRSTADEVLDRPEFQRPGPTLLQRIRNWIVDRVERAFGSLLGRGQAQLLAWIVLVGAVAVVVFGVIRFGRGMTPDATRREERRIERRRTPEEWRAQADAHARAGRWREAVRYRYRALVADLGARGLVDDVPGRTAGEYRREVAAAAPEVAPAFSEASDVFETAWYGRRPTDEGQDRRLRELSDAVLSGSS
jgi:hypothetical protein